MSGKTTGICTILETFWICATILPSRPCLVYLLKNSPTVEKGAALFKMASIKNCEIKGRGQKMAVMMKVDGKNFNNNNSGQFVLSHFSHWPF